METVHDKQARIQKGFNTNLEDYFVKARSGKYADNSQNKKLGRVGQDYGSKKKEDEGSKEKQKLNPDQLDKIARGLDDETLKRTASGSPHEHHRVAAHTEINRRQSDEANSGNEEKTMDDHVDDAQGDEKYDLEAELKGQLEGKTDKEESEENKRREEENLSIEEQSARLSAIKKLESIGITDREEIAATLETSGMKSWMKKEMSKTAEKEKKQSADKKKKESEKSNKEEKPYSGDVSKIEARIKKIESQEGSRKLTDEKYKLQDYLKEVSKKEDKTQVKKAYNTLGTLNEVKKRLI